MFSLEENSRMKAYKHGQIVCFKKWIEKSLINAVFEMKII